MGSNGIRFSVSDLSPPLSRILPTLVSYRLDISLYEAQYDGDGNKRPIPQETIDEVVAALLHFIIICQDLGVQNKHVRIVATEATRTAVNSEEYRKVIRDATGLVVEMLGKEEEGFVGALGVASGFSDVSGLVLDMGGGSVQMTWLESEDGHVRTSNQGSVSFPYGAAALTKRLKELKEGKSKEDAELAVAEFRGEIKEKFIQAYHTLQVPDDMVARAVEEGGFPLYLSGGGFRGWGYLLLYMSQIHKRHYPISLINGYSAPRNKFADVDRLKKIAKQADQIFRVSDRRRAQVPAVAFLVNVLTEALPHGVKIAHFAQGGVREGVLFRELDADIRKEDPLETATKKFATHKSAGDLTALIKSAVPKADPEGRKLPDTITKHDIHAFANTLYAYDELTKETASASALYSTSTGIICGTHGISHEDRALLALMLAERYGGELPPREEDFKESLHALLTSEEVWWTRYLGRVGHVIASIYPSGTVDNSRPRIRVEAEWASGFGKSGQKEGLRLKFVIKKTEENQDPLRLKELLESLAGKVKKVGKKKNWIGGPEGWGMSIDVIIKEVKHLYLVSE